MARVLVVGGTGLAGRAIVAEAVGRGHDVVVASRRVPDDDNPSYVPGAVYTTADLVTGDGLVAASASLVWLPARLPHDTCRELDEGTKPAGTILAPLGMRREDRRAMATGFPDEITGEPRATASSAVLVVDGQRVAVAEEFVMLRFAETLA